MNLERCCVCDYPTGRAGKGEDSIYICEGDLGPLCLDCHNKIVEEVLSKEVGTVARRTAALDLLVEQGLAVRTEDLQAALDESLAWQALPQLGARAFEAGYCSALRKFIPDRPKPKEDNK